MVIQNRDDCLAEAKKMLSDKTYYSSILSDPSKDYNREYTNLINEAFDEKIITDKEKNFLLTKKTSYSQKNPKQLPITTYPKYTKTHLTHPVDPTFPELTPLRARYLNTLTPFSRNM